MGNTGVFPDPVGHAARMRNRLPALVAVGALVVLAGVVARGTSAVPVGEAKPLVWWLRLPMIHQSQSTEAPPRGRVTDVRGPWATIVEWAILLIPVAVLVLAICAAVMLSLRARRFGAPTPGMERHREASRQGDPAGGPLPAAQAAPPV